MGLVFTYGEWKILPSLALYGGLTLFPYAR